MHGHYSFGDDIAQDIHRGEAPASAASQTSGPAQEDDWRRRPARQRVELLNEQQWLRRQLSDWDDFDLDDAVDTENGKERPGGGW